MKTAYFIINNVKEKKIYRKDLIEYLDELKYIEDYLIKFNLFYNRIIIKIYYDPKVYRENKFKSILNKLKRITKLKTIPMFLR